MWMSNGDSTAGQSGKRTDFCFINNSILLLKCGAHNARMFFRLIILYLSVNVYGKKGSSNGTYTVGDIIAVLSIAKSTMCRLVTLESIRQFASAV